MTIYITQLHLSRGGILIISHNQNRPPNGTKVTPQRRHQSTKSHTTSSPTQKRLSPHRMPRQQHNRHRLKIINRSQHTHHHTHTIHHPTITPNTGTHRRRPHRTIRPIQIQILLQKNRTHVPRRHLVIKRQQLTQNQSRINNTFQRNRHRLHTHRLNPRLQHNPHHRRLRSHRQIHQLPVNSIIKMRRRLKHTPTPHTHISLFSPNVSTHNVNNRHNLHNIILHNSKHLHHPPRPRPTHRIINNRHPYTISLNRPPLNHTTRRSRLRRPVLHVHRPRHGRHVHINHNGSVKSIFHHTRSLSQDTSPTSTRLNIMIKRQTSNRVPHRHHHHSRTRSRTSDRPRRPTGRHRRKNNPLTDDTTNKALAKTQNDKEIIRYN